MEIKNTGSLPLGTYSNLSNYQSVITHFVTTRHGGVSRGSHESFNLNFDDEEKPESVLENRLRLANSVGLSTKDFVFPHQVHGINVVTITEADRGKGAFSNVDVFEGTDGFITNVPKLCLITKAADCVPIIFYDPLNKAIGVAHAGWKGTVLRIPTYLVESMKSNYNTNPSDLIVGIGPSGGPCCYEVGDDVIEQVEKSFDLNKVIKRVNGKTIFDMWEANRITLIESGVRNLNIETASICTISENDKFFSARKGDAGRFVAGIFLNV
jgi:polyphenol oxidase